MGIFLGTPLILVTVAAVGLQRDLNELRARPEAGDTELQSGIADLLRSRREVRRRIVGARDEHVRMLWSEAANSTWDVDVWLDDQVLAEELCSEWREVGGNHATDEAEFERDIGPLTRENLLAHLDRGIAIMVDWQRRLRE